MELPCLFHYIYTYIILKQNLQAYNGDKSILNQEAKTNTKTEQENPKILWMSDLSKDTVGPQNQRARGGLSQWENENLMSRSKKQLADSTSSERIDML